MVIVPGSLDLALLSDRSRCPSCSAVLAASVCGTCGADLTGATAARVWDVSQQILALAADRRRLVDVLRQETAQRLAATAPAVLATPGSAAGAPALPQGSGAVPAPPYTVPGTSPAPGGPVGPGVPGGLGVPGVPPVPPVPAQPAGPARPRVGVQGVLVGLGALLLAVAALVFLVFAWDTLGLAGRAAVVGGVTVAALAGAAWLRPRLEATAEAVGALAAVLVLADVWAVRRTGLLGADDVDGLAYWGTGLLVAAVLLTAWALRWKVRAGSVTAAAVTPVAALLLGLATGSPAPDPRAAGLGLVAAAAVTAVRRWTPAHWRGERVVLRAAAVLALLLLPVAALAAFGDGRGTAAALLAGGAVAAGLGAIADRADRAHRADRADRTDPADRADRAGALSRAWAGAGGALGAAAAACLGSRLVEAVDAPAWGLVVPVALAAVLVVAAAVAAGLLDRAGVPARSVALGALGVVALLLTADLLVVAAAGVLPVLAAFVRPWAAGAGTTLELVVSGDGEAVGVLRGRDVVLATLGAAVTGALLLAAVAAGRGRPGAALPRVAAWAGALPLATAAVGALLVPALPLGASVGGLVLLAAVAAVAGHRLPAGRTASRTLTALAVVAGLVAALVAWNVDVLSVPVTLAGTAGLLVARPAVPARLRPVLLAAALVAAAVAAGGAAGLLGASVADRVTAAGVVAALLAAAVAQPLPRTATADRVAGVVAGAVVAAVTVIAALLGAGGAEPAEPGRLAVLAGALAAALAAVALAPRGAAGAAGPAADTVRRLRAVAAAGVPGAVAAAGGFVAESAGRAQEGVVVAAGAVAAAALALTALVVVRPATVRDPRRGAVEAGAAVAGLLSLAVVGDVDTFWVVLLLLGAGAAGVAALPDRRRVGWLALALLTASSWLRLWIGDVDVVEAYSLPPAAALLAVAALRLRRDAAADPWRALAPGAGLALVPSVLAAAGGGDLRPALVLGAGALLAAAGLVRHRAGAVLAVAGALAAAGTGLLRPLVAAARAQDVAARLLPAADVEVWSVPAGLVVLGAAAVLAVRHGRIAEGARGLLVVPGLTVLTVPTWAAALAVPGDRVLRFAAAGGVLAVAALVAAGRPLVRPSGAVAVLLGWPAAVLAGAGAGVVALTAWAVLPDVPFEVFSAGAGTLAVALGALRMAAVPALRSWPALGGGLVLALAPTVVLGSGGALWRVLGLVVAGGLVVAVGAARRLQAPVVVGGSALAAHALVQVAPFVAELTTSQWRWVVFAAVGAGLLVLGATYERRLAELRRARTALSTLR